MRFKDVPVGERGARRPLSVLGFGGSPLLGRAGRRESLQALQTALECGINFFDTARSYGYGESESLLGEFFAGRRSDVVLCTKFGILPGHKGGWKQKVKPAAQAIVRMIPALRGVARQAAAGSSIEGQFSPAVLHASFEESLRQLRTDYVDMLLMHAAPLSVLQQDDLLEAMARLVEQGKVRMAGISGEHAVIRHTFAQRPAMLTTAQFAVNPQLMAFTRETRTQHAQQMLLVANHPFGGPVGVAAVKARIEALRRSETLPAALREKLTEGDGCLLPEVVLNTIITGTGISAVVPAMMHPENLRRNVRAVTACRFTAEELALLRDELIRNP